MLFCFMLSIDDSLSHRNTFGFHIEKHVTLNRMIKKKDSECNVSMLFHKICQCIIAA